MGVSSLIRRALAAAALALLVTFSSASGFAREAGSTPGPSTDVADMSIEQLMDMTVSGASRFEQKLRDAPSSVSVVTADEIRKYGYRTLADILSGLRGFQVSNDRTYWYVGVRGFGRTGDFNSRILVLLDGHRINENSYGGSYLGTESLVDVDLIQRIEVIRGPTFSLYGNNAFFAVINVITRKGGDIRGFEVSGEAGSLETYGGRLTWGKEFPDGTAVLLSGSLLDRQGHRQLYFPEYDSPATNNGIAENLDRDAGRRFSLNASKNNFTLAGGYVSRSKAIPTAYDLTVFNDPRFKWVDSRGYADLKYANSLPDGSDVEGRIYYDYYDFYGDGPFGDAGDVVLNRDTARSQWVGGQFQWTKRLFERHKVIAGGGYDYNYQQRFETHDVDPYIQYLDVNRRTRQWAFFAQEEFTATRWVLLSAGVRYDHFDSFGGTVNPRLALIVSPAETSTLKLVYSTAFRAPSAYEMFYDAPAFNMRGNPQLQPERIRTIELIGEQFVGERLRFTATGYVNRITSLINQVTDPVDNVLVFRNIGAINAKGAEIEAEGRWDSGVQGRLSYTFQSARDADTRETLVNSPRHMLKINVIAPLVAGKVFAGIEEQYMSRRNTLAGNHTGGFTTANVTLFSRGLVKGLEASG
ncbi:MAG TPA: TonB-dependent receptor, partial [Candidatus Methylomirabilis sp.]|nr:TonB-dependent receptor [Candidatus Methylomirabilis sp.]